MSLRCLSLCSSPINVRSHSAQVHWESCPFACPRPLLAPLPGPTHRRQMEYGPHASWVAAVLSTFVHGLLCILTAFFLASMIEFLAAILTDIWQYVRRRVRARRLARSAQEIELSASGATGGCCSAGREEGLMAGSTGTT